MIQKNCIILYIQLNLYGIKVWFHLMSVLLQIVWLSESDILDIMWQAAASVVSVVKHHSLQVTVQYVDSERWGAATALIASRLIWGGQRVYKSSRNIWDSHCSLIAMWLTLWQGFRFPSTLQPPACRAWKPSYSRLHLTCPHSHPPHCTAAFWEYSDLKQRKYVGWHLLMG